MGDAQTSLLSDAPLRAAITRHQEMMVGAGAGGAGEDG